MKLELKHLAPYLPYGLKCKWNQSKPFELKGLQHGSDSVNNEMWIWKDKTYFIGYLYECKPILRPLSDLKTIEKEIKSVDSYWYVDDYLTEKCTVDKIYPLHVIEFIPYAIMQVLLKYHFDVFGLIEKGLAIDINTIN